MRKLALIILDGWGLGDEKENNAIHMANTPFFDSIWKKYPSTQLHASGEFVGLPRGQIGGSEVGHLTIGAGRILFQQLPRINRSFSEIEKDYGALQINSFVSFLKQSLQKNSHLIGLISPGGVHSHEDHLLRLLEVMKIYKCKEPYIHFISDGRDVSPTSGKKSAEKLISKIRSLEFGKIVTLVGRFYAMDRDNNLDRTNKAGKLITRSVTESHVNETDAFSNLLQTFNETYSKNISDEFIEPTLLDSTYRGIHDEEPIFFFNFRNDRMKQLVREIAKDFPKNPIYTMTQYDKDFPFNVIFEKEIIENTVSEILSKHKLTQLKATETEKAPHVTYFFNGGVEVRFEGEQHSVAPSNKVKHDEIPEMQASKIAQNIRNHVMKEHPNFILVNFANPDMVGHTGNFKAVVAGVESVDRELKGLTKFLTDQGYICAITADHGNADIMYDLVTKEPHTAHTLNQVPFIIYDPSDMKNQRIHLNQDTDNGLSKIAGTILQLMDSEKIKHDFDSLIEE